MLESGLPATRANRSSFLRASFTALTSASSLASCAREDPITGELMRVAPALASGLKAAPKRSISAMVKEIVRVTLKPINCY